MPTHSQMPGTSTNQKHSGRQVSPVKPENGAPGAYCNRYEPFSVEHWLHHAGLPIPEMSRRRMSGVPPGQAVQFAGPEIIPLPMLPEAPPDTMPEPEPEEPEEPEKDPSPD